jgi:phosphoribosylaminoimidazolecarboxamide formyltransferase/IMP cyclohydrolase
MSLKNQPRTNNAPKQLALLSVSNKTSIVPLAQSLVQAGYIILSTGGTQKKLAEAGVKTVSVESYTKSPEMFGGRVKTLHPKIHGGILYNRANKKDVAEAAKHGVLPIDIVVVNLYPFAQTVADGGSFAECIEDIDIGGVALIRASAKNHAHVAIVTNPADYERVQRELDSTKKISKALRTTLAQTAFEHTAQYDSAIAQWFAQSSGTTLPDTFALALPKTQHLRYGENPHQQAALYGNWGQYYTQLHGKELSYNNMLDIASAHELIESFRGAAPTVAILKHTNPCGVGQGNTLVDAWDKAYATDTSAPFGGIVVTNTPVTEALAQKISELFLEVIIAPKFDRDALTVLQQKKNLRLVTYKKLPQKGARTMRSVAPNVLLVQDTDTKKTTAKNVRVVTKRAPNKKELDALLFGFTVVKNIKSNAVVFCTDTRTLGIGAGQMSRVDSTKIAVRKAGEAKLDLKGSVFASDAFFPFADAVAEAAKAGATAIIQPGGSIRDDEVIAEANKHNIAMVFTGVRHFKH